MTKKDEEMILRYFQEHPESFIKEVAENTGFSKSTVQRTLQSKGDILLFSTGKTIQKQLEENKLRGRKNGGKTTFSRYDVKRGKSGKILGTKKTTTLDKVERKEESVRFVCEYYLENPNLTLEELANLLEDLSLYKKSFVFHCLRDASTIDIIGKEKYDQIQDLLDQKKYSFFRKIGNVQFMNYVNDTPLSPMERAVLLLRFHNHSLEDVAKEIHVSRTTAAQYEDHAIALLRETVLKGSKK